MENHKNIIIIIVTLSIIWGGYSFIFDIYNYTFGIFFSFLYILFFLILNPEKKYYVILFTLPFASIFKVSSSVPSSIIVLYAIYIIHIFTQKNIKFKRVDILFIIMIMLFQFISMTFYQGSYTTFLSFILNIIFMKVCIHRFSIIENKSEVLANSTYVFSTAMFASIIITDLFPKIPYIVLRDKQTILMSINRFSGLNGDPNYYSQLVLVAVCLVIAYLLVKQKKYRIILLILCSFLVVNGFRGISKSYALSIMVILVISFFYFNNSTQLKFHNSRFKKIFLSLCFFSIGTVSLFIVVQNFVIPIFELRTDTDDILTGRGDIWLKYLELIYLKPEILLIGVGFSNDANILGKELGIYMAPHNIYIELLVGCGVLGVLLLLLFFKDLFTNFKSTIRSPYFMFFIIILFTSFGLSLSSNDAFYILVPLIILLRTGVNSNEKTSNNHTYSS